MELAGEVEAKEQQQGALLWDILGAGRSGAKGRCQYSSPSLGTNRGVVQRKTYCKKAQ